MTIDSTNLIKRRPYKNAKYYLTITMQTRFSYEYYIYLTLSPTPDGSIQSRILRRRIQASPYRCHASVLV